MVKKFIASITGGDCCIPAGHTPINRSTAEETAKVFAALADPTRLSILKLLAENGEEVCVCEITAAFTIGQPTISHHLRILKEAGLVTGVKRGKWVHYSLVPGHKEALKELVEQVFGIPALA